MPVTEKKKLAAVSPFGIEADHPRNCDLLLGSLANTRLRSTIKPTKMVFDREDGEMIERPAAAGMIDGLPAVIPGMQLHVNPGDCTCTVIDPLYEDEDTLEKIRKAMKRSGVFISVADKIRGLPTKKHTLKQDEMKTLVRELFNLIEAQEARVVRGTAPAMEDIEDLPGHFLTIPVNSGGWKVPRYEKDMDAWVDSLNRIGG